MYRWIDNGEEQLKAMKRTWELIFGLGSAKRSGQQVTLIIMHELFSKVCVAYPASNALLIGHHSCPGASALRPSTLKTPGVIYVTALSSR